MFKNIRRLIKALADWAEAEAKYTTFVNARNQELYEQSQMVGQKMAEAMTQGRVVKMPDKKFEH